MNEDILKGRWTQLKARVRERWGSFTDDDLAQIEGDTERLMGKIQEYYGRSRAQAEEELQRWLKMERLT